MLERSVLAESVWPPINSGVLELQVWSCPECGERVPIAEKVAHVATHERPSCEFCGDTLDSGADLAKHNVRILPVSAGVCAAL